MFLRNIGWILRVISATDASEDLDGYVTCPAYIMYDS